MKIIKKFIITIIFAFIVSLIVGPVIFYYYSLPVSESDEVIVIQIERGETLRSISTKLEENHLIRSRFIMMAISRVMGTEQQMKSGQYGISRNMNTMEIHRLIYSGAAMLYRVTIPEGLTVSRIAAILEDAQITDRESFFYAVASRELIRKFNIPGYSLEGYLFPDSYMFPQNYSAERVVSHMVSNFFKRLALVYPEYKNKTPGEINDRVILASIIEREYRVPREAPMMASVFWNRLNIGMQLGSCATIEYIITEILGRPHPTRITYADLRLESDYNTYTRFGLPPGPISNPGEIALNAAFNPAETDYLFFLLRNRDTGEHFFSTRLADHNRARDLYLR